MARPTPPFKTARITVTIPAHKRGEILKIIEKIKKEETVKALTKELEQ